MPVVEYLFIVPKTDSFCSSVESFNRLLQVDEQIKIDGGKIHHRDDFQCDYAITSGQIEGKEQRFFHLRFGMTDDGLAAFDRLAEFLKAVRSILYKIGCQPETLWDDISLFHSQRGYQMIHRIESLMRKLIANFMLVNVGKEWVDEAAPADLKEAIGKSRRGRGDYLNALHRIDFIDLAGLLLKPYSNKTTDQLYAKLRVATTVEELNELREFVPESNWTRYFSKLVDCDDQYLKLRWNELYDLRCKIAHNAIVEKTDLERISVLVEELQSKLQDAIQKLPQVKVPPSEVRLVAENAAFKLGSPTLGPWFELRHAIKKKADEFGWGGKRHTLNNAIKILAQNGVFTDKQVAFFRTVHQLQNDIQSNRIEFSDQELATINRSIALIRSHIDRFASPSQQWSEDALKQFGGNDDSKAGPA